MRDSSEDFFSSFDQSPQRPQNRRPPPGPPPPAGAQRPQPPSYQQPPQQRARPPPNHPPSYVLSGGGHAGNPPAAPVPSPGYYGAPPPAAPAPAPQPYAAAPQYQPPPQQHHQFQQPNASSATDWYANQQQQTPQQQTPMMHQQQQPYAGGFAPAPQQPQPGLDGSMDGGSNHSGSGSAARTFAPTQNTNMYATKDLEEEEPPLLEELGINVDQILMKTKAVVIPFRRFQKNTALSDPTIIMEDADLAGPLALAMLLGGELLMTGKLQFGSIYGFGLFGCLAMTLVMNLMSPSKPISFWTVTSVLGYALLPVNILALLKILFLGYFTEFFAIVTILWSTTAATRLLEVGCGMGSQRYLLAYPIALLYSAFVLITIF